MIQGVSHMTVLVRNYDDAIQWYTEVLGLELRGDYAMGEGFRWVTVGVDGQSDLNLVLHQPHSENQENQVGKLGLGVLASTDTRADVERLRGLGVAITGEPTDEPWGVMAMFEDLYGNGWVMVQPPSA